MSNMKYRVYNWKPNTPIKILLSFFEYKKSGKVKEARKEIQQRFDGLDWKDQKRFLHLCLDSCATDRKWAYGKLWWMWDKSFEEKVRRIWEETHEDKAQWSIIQHFPIEYVRAHMDELDNERDYYFLCLRLVAETPDFVVEKNRLTQMEYLKVMRRGERMLMEEEARDLLYLVIALVFLSDEPGIYIPGLGGFRHSDTVIVTKDGYEILTGE